MLVVEPVLEPGEHRLEAVRLVRRRRQRDELALTAVALRCDDHAARDGGGGGRAEFAADDVQARVDARSGARARDDVAVVHEQDVRVDLGVGEAFGELGDVAPVGGAAAVVEQTGRPEDEGAAAHGEQRAAASAGFAERFDDGGWVVGADRGGGDGDQVGLVEGLEAVVRGEGGADAGGDGFAGVFAADAEVEGRDAFVGAVDAEDFADHAELERREPVDDHGGNGAEHAFTVLGRILMHNGTTANCGSILCTAELVP